MSLLWHYKIGPTWWARSIFQTDFQGQFFLPVFALVCNFSWFLFLHVSYPQTGNEPHGFNNQVKIYVDFHLIRKNSGRPKNSFRCISFLKELDTCPFFREKIIKFKKAKAGSDLPAAMTGHTEEIHGILKPFGFCYVCWNSTNCDLYLFKRFNDFWICLWS